MIWFQSGIGPDTEELVQEVGPFEEINRFKGQQSNHKFVFGNKIELF